MHCVNMYMCRHIFIYIVSYIIIYIIYMVLYMSNISCILQMWTAWIYVKSIITIKVIVIYTTVFVNCNLHTTVSPKSFFLLRCSPCYGTFYLQVATVTVLSTQISSIYVESHSTHSLLSRASFNWHKYFEIQEVFTYISHFLLFLLSSISLH